MVIDILPVWALFVVTIGVVFLAAEIGFRLGQKVRLKTADEREGPASSIAGVILGLQAFMLAFTFGIVSDRYDTRKSLVREEANTVRTTWRRADFLAEVDRAKTTELLQDYVERRIAIAQSTDIEKARESLKGFRDTQQQLWDIAVANGRLNLDSDVGALYIESVNELTNLHASRTAIGLDTRIPTAIWSALLGLLLLGMMAIGYHSAIADSRRSRVIPVLAVAFSLIVTLIAALDQPGNSLLPVSQQPLANVLAEMQEHAPAH